MQVFGSDEWRTQARVHAARVATYVEPHLARRTAGVKHPVYDFLFSYYTLSPAKLARWHPGYGVGLAEGGEYEGLRGYEVVGGTAWVARPYLNERVPLIEQTLRLLAATAGRAGTYGCFGLHEWAMVYGTPGTRHAWPLRLGSRGTDEVVEGHRIACSHFDAYRFFTEPARPLNTLRPSSSDRVEFEQPGCLHANMDLYKHAFRLLPLVPSHLVADCFELAWQIRTLDMQASPYDLADLGLEPIRIETADGKQRYAARQRQFSEAAAPLRQRLIETCEGLLDTASKAEVELREWGAVTDAPPRVAT